MKPVYYKLDPFAEVPIDLAEIAAKVTERTVAIVINTPHNPTGAVIGRETLIELGILCERNDLYLVSDEAYEHVIYHPWAHYSIGSLFSHPKVVSIFSCSKSYAMSGLRLGYVVCKDNALISKMSKMIRCTINGVNSITQWGAVTAILNTPQEYFDNMGYSYLNRRDALFRSLEKCHFLEPVCPKGAFYIWAKIKDNSYGINPEGDGWDATAYLLENGVGSAPGCVFGPGGKGHVRFAFSCKDEYIDMASEILKKL